MGIFFEVIFNNLVGLTFDWLIIFVGIANAVIFFIVKRYMRTVSESLNISQNMSLPIFIPPDFSPKELQNLDKLSKSTEQLYSLFVAITSVFALLGILGTVFSLIMLVGGDLVDVTQQSFFVALTSTFWGVTFAIIYRICDARISTKIQSNSEEVARLKQKEAEKQRAVSEVEATNETA